MEWESRILPNINELLKIKCQTRVLTLLRRFAKCGCCASGEGRNFLGKFYNRIKLVVIMELSEIDCLISCIPTRILAATRILGSIKSFLRLLRLLLCDLSAFRVASSPCCITTICIPCHSVYICNLLIPLRPLTALWRTKLFLIICFKCAKYDKVSMHIKFLTAWSHFSVG